MKLAYFSPLPPQRSGIADYSRELLPHLANHTETTVFFQGPDTQFGEIVDSIELRRIEEYEALRNEFDLALYHIGNSAYHDEISRLAIRYPGVVVLHDFFLHHSVARRTIGMGNRYAYLREMGYESGAAGIRRAMASDKGESLPLFKVPLNKRLLDVSLGVIVHSKYAAQLAREQECETPVAIIPAIAHSCSGRSRREELGVPENVILFASFGLITKEKLVLETLRAMRNIRPQIPDAHFLLVGDSLADVAVDKTVTELGLEGAVHNLGFVPQLNDFIDWIASADVVINLRSPTVGETSATALRAMAAAKPLIVSDQGWYSEIPGEAAIKIPVGEAHSLEDAMRRLGESAALRKRMGLSGRRYVTACCTPALVAEAYVTALNRIQQAAASNG